MSRMEELPGQLSVEWQFLLACASTHSPREDLPQLAHVLSSADVNWALLTDTARQHGIAPLVYHQLQRSGLTEIVPSTAMDVLQQCYYSNALRNALLYAEIRQVLTALQEQDIRTIVLKGAALAETVYHHRAVRPMNDIDLLISKPELSRIQDTLVTMNYAFDGNGKPLEWFKEQYYQIIFRKCGLLPTDIHFEMHWHIERPSRPFTIDINGLWERAVPVIIAGVNTLTLSPEDMLLHLCLHTCHHRFTFGLRPLCDIATTIRQYGHTLEWEQMHRRACEWGILPYVYLPLSLARALLDAPITAPTLEALRPHNFDARLVAWACSKALTASETPPISSNVAQLWKGHGLQEKVMRVLETFSAEAIARNYPVSATSYKVYLYYPARLQDLCRRYGPAFLRLCCGDQHLATMVEHTYTHAQLDTWLDMAWGAAPP